MSVQAFFSEVEAVVAVLQDYVEACADGMAAGYGSERPTEEDFTAIWQAAELLARAHAYISAQINAEVAVNALNLPDVQMDAPPTPKKGRLYGPNGAPL